MEHQYPVAITGDENMLAELMLPDQAHARNQDWTIFFLHKDTSQEEEDANKRAKEKRQRTRRRRQAKAKGVINEEDGDDSNGDGDGNGDDNEEENYDQDEEDILDDVDDESTDSEPEGGEGPPLIHVLNLVNTKHDKSVKRGAVVRAMAICTRHPFLHIYKVGFFLFFWPKPIQYALTDVIFLIVFSFVSSLSYFSLWRNTLSHQYLRRFPCCTMPSTPWTSP